MSPFFFSFLRLGTSHTYAHSALRRAQNSSCHSLLQLSGSLCGSGSFLRAQGHLRGALGLVAKGADWSHAAVTWTIYGLGRVTYLSVPNFFICKPGLLLCLPSNFLFVRIKFLEQFLALHNKCSMFAINFTIVIIIIILVTDTFPGYQAWYMS